MRKTLLFAACCALSMPLAAHAQPRGSERQFIEKAIKGDNSEAMLGGLAAERGASPGVRDFGRTLRDDHQRAKGEATQVATRLGAPVPDGIMPEAQQERRKLDRLHGRAFDRE